MDDHHFDLFSKIAFGGGIELCKQVLSSNKNGHKRNRMKIAVEWPT